MADIRVFESVQLNDFGSRTEYFVGIYQGILVGGTFHGIFVKDFHLCAFDVQDISSPVCIGDINAGKELVERVWSVNTSGVWIVAS